ncbi:MAG: hypothetical protein F6J87_03285 [Spirulina sp. SIO3F2]|nr:hypothetical protein [Spirulina sp. SIO3F2]
MFGVLNQVIAQSLGSCLALTLVLPNALAFEPHHNKHNQLNSAVIHLAQSQHCVFPVYPNAEVEHFEHLDVMMEVEESINIYRVGQSVSDVFSYYQEQLTANSLCFELNASPIISEEISTLLLDVDSTETYKQTHYVYSITIKSEDNAQWYLHISQVEPEMTTFVLLPNALKFKEVFNIPSTRLDINLENLCRLQEQGEDFPDIECDQLFCSTIVLVYLD